VNAKLSPSFPRRWLRFRIRSLLAFMALCGIASSYAGGVNAYYAEQRAMEGLRRIGGSIDVNGTIAIYH
jgi:hypothetical protein